MRINEVYEGDCLEVMRQFPDNCIDSIITDPPYSLGDQKSASARNSILDIFFDVVFPDFYNLYAQFETDVNFVGPFDSIMFLDFMNRSIWEKSGVTMPKSAIDFNPNIMGGNEEIQNSGISSVGVSNRVLTDKIDAENFKLPSHYFFNVRPFAESSFSNGKTCGFRQLGPSRFSVPVIVPLNSSFAGFLCSLAPSDAAFFGDIIGFLDGSKSQSKSSSFIVTKSGTEIIIVLSFDLSRGTFEFLPTDGTNEFGFLFEFSTPKDIRTFAAASRLSSVFKPLSFSFVNGATDRTFSLYFHKDIITEINRNRKGFMGKEWDSEIAFNPEVWREALRVAKPGATLMAFGGTRTYHRLVCAIEDAGWEIRDGISYFHDGTQQERAFMASLDEEQLAAYLELHYPNRQMTWVYGSGFPKSKDISKAIDKAKGAEREVVGYKPIAYPDSDCWSIPNKNDNGDAHKEGTYTPSGNIENGNRPVTAPATPLAKQFDGWGTALKPAYEPIVVAQKPIDRNYAHNAEKWGVSGIWVDGGRIGSNPGYKYNSDRNGTTFHGQQGERIKRTAKKKGGQFIESSKGRWPANIIHDGSDEVEAEFAKAGVRESGAKPARANKPDKFFKGKAHKNLNGQRVNYDSGTPSRYFAQCPPDPTQHPDAARFHYCPKASTAERGSTNNHPTVKPLSLMRHLCRLTKTPTGGIVLDPFAGSGTTALAAIAEEGCDFILIEKNADYAEICRRRIAEYTGQEIAPVEIKTNGETGKQLPLW